MLDMNGIVETMRAEGFEVTAEDVAEVHQGMKNGRVYTGAVDREIVQRLQRHLAQALGDGQVENAGF
jgi:hypothetical protein